MRRNIILGFVCAIMLSSCLKDKVTKSYTVFEPVYKEKSEVLADIKSKAPAAIANPGKIYMYGSYIFLNEINKGVHIIDNSNTANPQLKAFINIPGNVDIAVKGSVLYADLYTDMVLVDISNPLNASLQKIVPKVFPERYYGNFIADSTKVIVDWVEKKVTVDVDQPRFNNRWLFAEALSINTSPAGNSGATKAITGIAGSMSRFAIINDYMYAVNQSSINVIDVSSVAATTIKERIPVGWNIETIYPFKNKLFIGSSNGMFIYNITNPALPVREGSFSHARACDPVVADDDYAFVTLRAGTFCQGTNNQLDVINVQNPLAPSLVKTYSLFNPHGLAKDGNLLFVCDGKEGLKIFNASNVNNLQQVSRINNLEAYDVIAWNKKLLLVANEGLLQYDYSNASNITQISKISVSR
jgi:hypothetical protein